jgi:hypothetical protein
LIGRSVTHEAQGHMTALAAIHHFISVFRSKGQPGTKWHLSTNNAMATVHMMFGVEEVHRPTFAFGAATDSAKEFGHTNSGVHASSQGVTMISIGCNNWIVRTEGRDTADRYALLPVINV